MSETVTRDMLMAGHAYVLAEQLRDAKPDVQKFCEGLYLAMKAHEPRSGSITDPVFDADLEREAMKIYDTFVFHGPGQKPVWVWGGNSMKQQDARMLARQSRQPLTRGEK